MATATITKTVKVAKLGSAKKEVELQAPTTTVGEVLEKAGLTGTGYEAMLNGSACKMSDPVQPGDVVALAPQVKGG